MKTFINAKDVKVGKEKIDQDKIDKFIERFNEIILKGDDVGESFSMNDALHNIDALNDKEFEFVVKEAKKQGWNLHQHNDSYDSVTYMIGNL